LSEFFPNAGAKKSEESKIPGCWIIHSTNHEDSRGVFREWFVQEEFSKISNHPLQIAQANISFSHERVIRGLHYSLSAAGQAKVVTCAQGEIFDVVVDLRPSSPQYMQSATFYLSGEKPLSIIIPSGVAHGFASLKENTIVTYLLTSQYSPTEEFCINPFDQQIGIDWPPEKFVLSEKDSSAPSIRLAKLAGTLPK